MVQTMAYPKAASPRASDSTGKGSHRHANGARVDGSTTISKPRLSIINFCCVFIGFQVMLSNMLMLPMVINNYNKISQCEDAKVDLSNEYIKSALSNFGLSKKDTERPVPATSNEKPQPPHPKEPNKQGHSYPYDIAPSSPYAYSFVVGSIHEDRHAYKGFLYNVFNTVHLLKKLGSTADFVLWAQLAPDSNNTHLPAADAQALSKLGVHVILMEKPQHESFAHLMYDKFRALQLTQYRRIVYLDSDVLPLVNMDYWFHLSDSQHTTTPTILRPNMVWASRGTPCNGGMFMMHPFPNAWKLLSETTEKQRAIGKTLPYPHFDWSSGWGHDFIKAGDVWEGFKRNDTHWRFHGGHSDQGLWYFYAKYLVQDCSIVVFDRVQNWGPAAEYNVDVNSQPELAADFRGYNPQTVPRLLNQTHLALMQFSPKPLIQQARKCDFEEGRLAGDHMCYPPYRDVAHYMGTNKPWQTGLKRAKFEKNTCQLWFEMLEENNQQLALGVDILKWEEKHLPSMKESPLGYLPKHGDNAKVIHS